MKVQMAFLVSAGCWVLLAAAAVLGYVQRHSQLESHIHYAQLGTDVTLQCGLVDPDAVVTWTANTTDLDASHLNGSRLVLHNVDLSHSGQYSCYEGTSWHLKYRVNLKVGTPPKEPILMCRSNNYPNGFYCSWHLPSPTYINDTFDITVMHDSKEIVCKKDIPAKNRCYIQYLHLFSSKKYRVTLTATNPLGSSSTTISFDEFTIVKPDPPENVVAKAIPNNPRRLLVTWQYPSSWPDPDSFPLKFFLRYRPLIIDQWQHVELSDGTSHIITDAYAGKEYIIQVAAKDNEIGTWSDWSVAVHATPWTEEPKHLTTEAQGTGVLPMARKEGTPQWEPSPEATTSLLPQWGEEHPSAESSRPAPSGVGPSEPSQSTGNLEPPVRQEKGTQSEEPGTASSPHPLMWSPTKSLSKLTSKHFLSGPRHF